MAIKTDTSDMILDIIKVAAAVIIGYIIIKVILSAF